MSEKISLDSSENKYEYKENNHCHVDHINLHWQYKRTRNEN